MVFAVNCNRVEGPAAAVTLSGAGSAGVRLPDWPQPASSTAVMITRFTARKAFTAKPPSSVAVMLYHTVHALDGQIVTAWCRAPDGGVPSQLARARANVDVFAAAPRRGQGWHIDRSAAPGLVAIDNMAERIVIAERNLANAAAAPG